MSRDATRFFIGGEWVEPIGSGRRSIINPSTEEQIGEVALGDERDVDLAVEAAAAAFPAFSKWTRAQRLDLLNAVLAKFGERINDIAEAVSLEMGAPSALAQGLQAPSGLLHFMETLKVLETFPFEEEMGSTIVRREPAGVAALITPWNWPVNQITAKVAPALAAGCTMVLKPSELAPLSASILTEIFEEAGVPAGVFNLVHGDGPGVGAPLTAHPSVDLVSFTGSTRAGVEVGKNAAAGIKRVALELGGKSANILLPDVDFASAVPASVKGVVMNSGQSCNAATRLLVPEDRYDEVAALAAQTAAAVTTGPSESGAEIGPVANAGQYAKVRRLIDLGVEEGAELLAGGSDRPEGLDKGYFVKPTIFGRVTRDMTIAREEIFGPVISIMTYESVDEAVEIANDSEYGLSGAVSGADKAQTLEVASRLRTGNVHVNGAGPDFAAPFGGYKKSGVGREWGRFGLEEFLETKAVFGAGG